MLGSQLLQAHEAEAHGIEVGAMVEVLVGASVGEQTFVPIGDGRNRELGNARRRKGFLHLWIGAERRGTFLEE